MSILNPFTPLADSQIVGGRKRQFIRNFSSTPGLKDIKKFYTSFGLDFDDSDPSQENQTLIISFSIVVFVYLNIFTFSQIYLFIPGIKNLSVGRIRPTFIVIKVSRTVLESLVGWASITNTPQGY